MSRFAVTKLKKQAEQEKFDINITLTSGAKKTFLQSEFHIFDGVLEIMTSRKHYVPSELYLQYYPLQQIAEIKVFGSKQPTDR